MLSLFSYLESLPERVRALLFIVGALAFLLLHVALLFRWARTIRLEYGVRFWFKAMNLDLLFPVSMLELAGLITLIWFPFIDILPLALGGYPLVVYFRHISRIGWKDWLMMGFLPAMVALYTMGAIYLEIPIASRH